MSATTADIAALTTALDAGDDAVLPILADALEEIGDPRAAGLRKSRDRKPTDGHRLAGVDNYGPPPAIMAWAWCRTRPGHSAATEKDRLSPRLFSRLPHPAPNYVSQIGRDRLIPYPTRSAAFLALAAALIAE